MHRTTVGFNYSSRFPSLVFVCRLPHHQPLPPYVVIVVSVVMPPPRYVVVVVVVVLLLLLPPPPHHGFCLLVAFGWSCHGLLAGAGFSTTEALAPLAFLSSRIALSFLPRCCRRLCVRLLPAPACY